MPHFFVSRFARTKQSGRGGSHRGTAVAVQRLAQLSPWWLCIVALGGLLLTYVWQMTLLATTGYERGSLERSRAAAEERLATMRVETLDQQALARVEERVREMRLVADDAVQYVTVSELARTLSRR